MHALVSLLQLSVALSACASTKLQSCSRSEPKPEAALTCTVPGFEERTYDIHLPVAYDPAQPVPVVLAIHGGGGNSSAAARTACPGGGAYSRERGSGPMVGGWSANRIILDFFRRNPMPE